MSSKNNETRDVKCNVSNCAYHDGKSSCLAGSIEVGPHNAQRTEETICSTFELNQNQSDVF